MYYVLLNPYVCINEYHFGLVRGINFTANIYYISWQKQQNTVQWNFFYDKSFSNI
uniref:Uncharacterized protein n=1 Tax=Arundo donax TaxID=35708 RepID=A0A0A9A642_ARUDO